MFDVLCVNLKKKLNDAKEGKGIYLFECRLNAWSFVM